MTEVPVESDPSRIRDLRALATATRESGVGSCESDRSWWVVIEREVSMISDVSRHSCDGGGVVDGGEGELPLSRGERDQEMRESRGAALKESRQVV